MSTFLKLVPVLVYIYIRSNFQQQRIDDSKLDILQRVYNTNFFPVICFLTILKYHCLSCHTDQLLMMISSLNQVQNKMASCASYLRGLKLFFFKINYQIALYCCDKNDYFDLFKQFQKSFRRKNCLNNAMQFENSWEKVQHQCF